MELLLVLFIFVSFLLVYFIYLSKKPSNFPPGPFSFPIVGNLIQVGWEPYKSVMAMKKRYGNIIRIDLGPKRSIFINEHGLIKEAYSLIAMSGRPLYQHFGPNRGMITTSGTTWLEQRRLAFSYIQSGFRNGVPVESLILHEANELMEHLRKSCGSPISTVHVFNISIINVLWGIVAGERFELTDPKILKIMYHINEYSSHPATQGILVFFYKWAKMFPELSGLNHFNKNLNPVLDFIKEIIDYRKETYQYQEGIQRDLIDCYLQKIKTTTDEKSSFFGKTGEENFMYNLNDILLGGSETISITMKWLVFLMAHHPAKQERLYDVITNYMRNRQHPSLRDRQLLPFVEAVIMEVLRFSSVLPIGILHEATEDVQFHGYLISKGTMIIANQHGVMHDPDVWGDPENFRPERFLNKDETEIIRHPALIPFSTGRRVCPGESLAKDELFLFTMMLFQKFKVEFDPSELTPSIKYVPGTINTPVKHKIIFSERF